MKEEFLKYIGDRDSLAGYTRSYKIVFLISYFELAKNSGSVSTLELARAFKRFYEERKQRGLVPDVDVESRIENIEHSTVDQVLSVIKDNPYKAINQKGFINIQSIVGEEYFSLDNQLNSEINAENKEIILKILRHKLNLYYGRIDNMDNAESLRDLLEKFMGNYVELRTTTPFAKHPTGALITDNIPNLMRDYNFIDNSKFSIKGSYGNGNWTHTPWIAVFNKNITQTVQEGVYIVYLFSSDMKRVYLTLDQGCTKLKNSFGKIKAIEKMKELSNKIRSEISDNGFKTDNDLKVGHELYEKGCIFYKEYSSGNIPEDEQLISDLNRMMNIYQEYYSKFMDKVDIEKKGAEVKVPTDVNVEVEADKELNIKDEVERISSYIRSKGFTYPDDLIMNFYLALKSKPFVILAGTSGTGKSKLIRLFAEAVGATSENERFKLIAVRPDWSDSTDLLGYRDLNGKFHPGVLTNVILKAKDNPYKPFFVCLDEMNLARVEYYLSDILSIMESRKWSSNRIVTDRLISEECLGNDNEDKLLYKDISIPDNLYIIGTVNMDETTFPFSKKVLDRANTIEFSYVDLDIKDYRTFVEPKPLDLNNSFFRSQYLLLEHCMEYEEKLNETISILKEINDVLQSGYLHFGYRIRDEICFYTTYNHIFGLLSFNQAMDNLILQKVLPRIQGSSASIKRLLINLFKICINNKMEQFSNETAGVNDEMLKYLNDNSSVSYRKSGEKIVFMMRRFEEDGFTSYWL